MRFPESLLSVYGMICEEQFRWKQLGEGMLLRALSPSSPWLASLRPLGSGQPMVTAAVRYFVSHGALIILELREDREVG